MARRKSGRVRVLELPGVAATDPRGGLKSIPYSELASLIGAGDVIGPVGATDNAIARFDGTTGKVLQNSIVRLTDAGRIENLTDPTAAQEAATKAYVDALAAVTQPVDGDLTAIAALSGTGFLARTAASTWALRTAQAGANISLTNPAGVAGDPTIAFARSVIADTQTGTENAWDPGGAEISQDCLVEWNGASNLTVNGIAGGAAGRIVWIKSIVSGSALTISLAHNSGSASAGDRLQNFATGAATPLLGGGSACYVHDGTDWKLLWSHQGQWITPTFAAGDFTGSGSMTWTVDSGDVSFDRYILIGKTVIYLSDYLTTTVGGTVGNTLSRALPALLAAPTGAGLTTMHARIQRNGGTTEHGAVYVADILNPGKLNFIEFTAANWILGTNNNRVQSTLIWEVG